MKMRSILGALVLASLSAMPALAENMTPEDIKKLVDEAVEKRLKEHERREGAMERREGAAAPEAEPGSVLFLRLDETAELRRSRPYPSDQPDPGVWSMPSLSCPPQKQSSAATWTFNTESHNKGVLETGGIGSGTTNGFDQQRFVPFIYADITEHVKFASEIEIEHGIRETSDNEISLEFAHIDYLVT